MLLPLLDRGGRRRGTAGQRGGSHLEAVVAVLLPELVALLLSFLLPEFSEQRLISTNALSFTVDAGGGS